MQLKAKQKFWDGIVVPFDQLPHYLQEDDSILIGPGFERGPDSAALTNSLLAQYPTKRWIIDGGALQEVNPTLLTSSMILTPNAKELQILQRKLGRHYPPPCTLLAKGPVDTITPAPASSDSSPLTLRGGSPGLTRGGTGDVLSGLVAGLAAKSPPFAACVVASYLVKQASQALHAKQGPFFSPLELIAAIPPLFWKTLSQIQSSNRTTSAPLPPISSA